MASFVVDVLDQTSKTITMGETGVVTQNGALVTFFDAVVSSGGTNSLNILGSLISTSQSGVDHDGSTINLTVGNNGFVGGNGSGLNLTTSSSADIDNAGVISGNSDAISISNLGGSANAFISNSGTIQGNTAVTGGLGTGAFHMANSGVMQAKNEAIEISAEEFNLSNTGTITKGNEPSNIDPAIEFSGTNAVISMNEALLTNSGDIIGNIDLVDSFDSIINTGLIAGNIFMGNGDDVFDGVGGTVNGTTFGGDGDDTYFIDQINARLHEDPAEGTDVMLSYSTQTLGDNIENMFLMGGEDIDGEGNNGGNRIEGNSGNNDISGLGGNDQLYGRNGDDALYGFTGLDLLNGGDGDDYLNGGANTDTLGGALGDDTMYGGDGNDNMFGNGGSDRMYGDSGNDTMNGQQDNDIVNGGNGNDTMTGGDGIDLMGGGLGDDVMAGDVGHDNMYGNGGNDNMNGGEGNDFMEGHDGNDIMRGSSGNDRINGGLGDDNLGGDSGADRFIFQNGWGDDIIADFQNGLDIIDMSNVAGVNSFSDLTVTFSAGSTFVSYEGDEIRLFAVNIANIGAEDFLF